MSESTTTPSRRGRFIAAMCIVALAAVAAIEHVKVHRLEQTSATHAAQSTLVQMNAQLTNLNRRLTALENSPAKVTQSQWDTTRQEISRRMANVIAVQEGAVTREELAGVLTRVASLEARAARARTTVVTPPISAVAPKAAALDPPFTPLSIELRGNGRVLSVLPAGAKTLGDAHVLRSGDREDGWVLEGLTDHTADFRVDGQVRRVTLP